LGGDRGETEKGKGGDKKDKAVISFIRASEKRMKMGGQTKACPGHPAHVEKSKKELRGNAIQLEKKAWGSFH